MSGSDAPNQPGTYGTKGEAASGNVPGSRASSITWTDASGGGWLFGGLGTGAANWGYLNDLWKWDGTNWAWMSGSDAPNQFGTYGTKGVAALTNMPGARLGSTSWVGTGGDLWLLGGEGEATAGSGGYLNDLWKWDGTNWAWVSGSDEADQEGTYGAKGVGAPGNVPGARNGSAPWTDASGNLWLFGGYGSSASGWGSFNDLWKWDGTNWTWVSGSNGEGKTATYGTKGVPAPANVPGARTGSVSWADAAACGSSAARSSRRHRKLRAQRPVEVGRDELDVGQRVRRGESARHVRDEGCSRDGKRAGSEAWFHCVDGYQRETLALRGPGRFRNRAGDSERPVELGRDELDLGERVRRGSSSVSTGRRGLRRQGTCRGRGTPPSHGRM